MPEHEDKLTDLLGGPLGVSPHRWFVFRPPFAGAYGPDPYKARSPREYRCDAYPERLLDVDTGRIWHKMWLTITDADNLDFVHCVLDSAVEVVFTAPVAGRVEVVFEATCGASLHELRLDDEFGFSQCLTDQMSFLTLQVLHPNISDSPPSLMSRLVLDTIYSTDRRREGLTPGLDYFVHQTTPEVVPAGDTMIIRAGARADDGTWTNDMEVSSTSTFEWRIKRVRVRIAP